MENFDKDYEKFLDATRFYENELGINKISENYGCSDKYLYMIINGHKNMELTHVAALLGDTPETISSRYLHPTAQMLQSKIKKASGWN